VYNADEPGADHRSTDLGDAFHELPPARIREPATAASSTTKSTSSA
jgi:hypothetical protein